MQKVIILRGVPASGKSTYAKQLVKDNPTSCVRINRDDIREMMNGYDLSKENEKLVKKTRDLMIMEALKSGRSVISDDTNISLNHQRRISDLARQYTKQTGNPTEVEIKEFEITLTEAIERDSKRKRPVGKSQITKIYNQLKGKKDTRGPHYKPQNTTLPPAIVCDLDGTLCIMNGRNPFDASSCESDLLNEPVADIVNNYHEKGEKIILLSGRTDKYIEETKRWLSKYQIPYDMLLMRKHGDSRKDAIIKKEIIDHHLWGKYYIRFVLDDRNQVVDMWRQEIGVACLQVNYGDF